MGLGLFYLSMQQVVALVPVTADFQIESFYYSQSSFKINLNIMGQYHDSIVVTFEHGPILSAQASDPKPWYHRLGFVKYQLQERENAQLVKEFEGYFTSGHYYHYALEENLDRRLDITGECYPLSYTHQTVIKGKWIAQPRDFYYSINDFVFVYDDPVTWARVRVPNVYLKAENLRIGDKLYFQGIDARLKIDKPEISTSVYGTLSVDKLKKDAVVIKNLTADVLIIDASTFYVQQFGEFFFQNFHDIIDSNVTVDWDLTPLEFIDAFEQLYPKFTVISIDGIADHNFDITLRQNEDVGLELISTGDPAELISLMNLAPWVVWDPSVKKGLLEMDLDPAMMTSVVWNPGKKDSLEFFAISPDSSKPA